jgi:hypothetical protein
VIRERGPSTSLTAERWGWQASSEPMKTTVTPLCSPAAAADNVGRKPRGFNLRRQPPPPLPIPIAHCRLPAMSPSSCYPAYAPFAQH